MRTTLGTFSLLLLFAMKAISQNIFIREFRFPQKVTVSDGSPSSPNAAVIIQKLAEGNGKTPRSTSFTIEFEQLLQVNTRERNHVFKITSGKLLLKGDINFRGFDMANELVPSELKYLLRLKRPNGSSRDIPLSVFIQNGTPETASFDNPDSINEFSNYDLVNHSVRYGNANVFENKIKLINLYYSQLVILDQGFVTLQMVNPDLVDNFRNNQKNLLLAEKILNETESLHFENNLPLSTNDPGRLMEKISTYKGLFLKKRAAMDYIWNTLHLNFFERGIYQLRKNNLQRAREFFLWSLEVNPLFAPALLQLAIIDFKTGDLHEAICKADDILYGLPSDPETRISTFSLLNDVYLTYIERGQQDIKKNNFRKALDEFESAKRICNKYTQVQCSEELGQGISGAKKGIYDEFLDEARDFIILDELDRAETVTREAINFQIDNRSDLKDASEAQAVLKGIRQKRYDQLLIKAMRLTDQKMYDAALSTFQKADSLLVSQDLNEGKDVRKSVLSAARPRIIELLYEGENYVKTNNLNAAISRYRWSNDLQMKYGLQNESDIIKHTQSLRKNIFTQECINVQQFADSCYNTGQLLEADEKYLEANYAYEAGLSSIRLKSDCAISTDSLESAMLQIRNAVTYLDLMKQVNHDQENGSYQNAIENFQKASRYFQDMNVQRYGLLHDPDLYRFIREKGTSGLINYSGDWYREKGELDHALSMYKLLLDRNYDFRFLSGSLYKLGMKTGAKDKPLNPGSKWKDLVKQYTGGDKRLKRFSKGYKAGFNH